MAKKAVDISVGPNVHKHVRRHKKPVGAVVIVGFIVLDSAKLHVLHHMFGQAGGIAVAAVLFFIAIFWGLLRWAIR